MRIEQKQAVKNSIGRLLFVGISILVQISWFVVLFMRLNNFSTGIALLSSLVALAVALRIYGRHMNAAFKMPWIILVLAFPVLGVCVYLLLGRSGANAGVRKKFAAVQQKLLPYLKQDPEVREKLESEDAVMANESYYIAEYGSYPVYQNTDVVFYPDAAGGLEAQLEALAAAEKFIFMEYHAIEDSGAFERIRDILTERAAAGVEVRLIYDDVGSVGFISPEFMREMEKEGISCRIFNPMVPMVNVFMNNRDHRKITVVDGRIGFTGGYNLADEYFNLTHPYGHWKDTGVRLAGDAVQSLTVMFLEMWNGIRLSDTTYEPYFSGQEYQAVEQGFVQPYADSPLDGEYVGENVYMNLIKGAKERIWFTTPYLIISDEMIRELGMAAKRGIDVRIITPGIPDKKIIFKVTRSYYASLVRQGVRIYEYTPGFIHAKQCVCDGEAATVGTINLDYRSLYHHFENGVLLYHMDAVAEVEKDFRGLFPVCEEVTDYYRDNRTAPMRIGQCILRLFAPLL